MPHVRAMLQGGTGTWFSVVVSVLSVPQGTDALAQLVEEEWVTLEKATTLEILGAFRQIGQLKRFGKFSDSAIWKAIQQRREGDAEEDKRPTDLKGPEWRLFSNPGLAPKEARDLKLRLLDPPTRAKVGSGLNIGG